MTTKIALAAFAAALFGMLGSSSPSQAQWGGGCYDHHRHRPCSPPVYRGTQHCYYLPTVANGRVTGVEKVCSWY
jgi:hypothetical protein